VARWSELTRRIITLASKQPHYYIIRIPIPLNDEDTVCWADPWAFEPNDSRKRQDARACARVIAPSPPPLSLLDAKISIASRVVLVMRWRLAFPDILSHESYFLQHAIVHCFVTLSPCNEHSPYGASVQLYKPSPKGTSMRVSVKQHRHTRPINFHSRLSKQSQLRTTHFAR